MIQTTNIRRIMDRVTRHPMLADIPFETVIEHTVDFLSLMGTPALYEEKTAIIDIDDWQGDLPNDFVEMIQVRLACHPFGVFRYSGHSFHMSDKKPGDMLAGLTYKTQGMTIFTSCRHVKIEIAYRAVMVDEEGYPLLPDNTSFLRGLENYIKVKWFEIKYEMGELPQDVMARAEKEYCWSAGDAQNEFSRLDLDKAQTLFNSFKTLLPRNSEHWRAFFTNGSKEIWKH